MGSICLRRFSCDRAPKTVNIVSHRPESEHKVVILANKLDLDFNVGVDVDVNQ